MGLTNLDILNPVVESGKRLLSQTGKGISTLANAFFAEEGGGRHGVLLLLPSLPFLLYLAAFHPETLVWMRDVSKSFVEAVAALVFVLLLLLFTLAPIEEWRREEEEASGSPAGHVEINKQLAEEIRGEAEEITNTRSDDDVKGMEGEEVLVSESVINEDSGEEMQCEDAEAKEASEVENEDENTVMASPPISKHGCYSEPMVFSPPCKKRPRGKDLTIVLDLDETLVQTCLGVPKPEFRARTGRACLKNHQLRTKTRGGRMEIATMYERPGLQEFLYRASQLGELVVFTAGTTAYAEEALAKIDKGFFVSRGFSKPSCTQILPQVFVKDLRMLKTDLARTVLVDNSARSFLPQPHNGILCNDFYANNGRDQELLQNILPLLEECSMAEDVRDFLGQKFNQREAFLQRGYEPSLVGPAKEVS